MPDWERALVSRLAQTGSLEEAIRRGITEEYFEDEQVQLIFRDMLDHARKYLTPPTFPTIREWHPHFEWELNADSLDYLFDGFTKLVKRRKAIGAMHTLARFIDDPNEVGRIDEHFLEVARDLSVILPTTEVARFSKMHDRIGLYHRRKFEGTAMGIPFGIPRIDYLTMGIQPHEYVTVVGWTGTGKSTLTQYLLFQAYLAGKTPMIFSLEMDQESLLRKWDTMATNFKYRALKAQELSSADLAKWEEWADRAAAAPNDMIIIDDVGKCTVDRVFSEMVRYKPDIVAIDYVSLMTPTRETDQIWQNITQITRGLKQAARTLKIPMIGVAQTNIGGAEKGAQLSNIAYSRSIAQDSDFVFGLHQEEEWRRENRMELRLLKNRDGMLDTVPLYWNMERMYFSEFRDSMPFRDEEEIIANG